MKAADTSLRIFLAFVNSTINYYSQKLDSKWAEIGDHLVCEMSFEGY